MTRFSLHVSNVINVFHVDRMHSNFEIVVDKDDTKIAGWLLITNHFLYSTSREIQRENDDHLNAYYICCLKMIDHIEYSEEEDDDDFNL